MAHTCPRVAHGLLLHGAGLDAEEMSKAEFLTKIGIGDTTFRGAAAQIGGKQSKPGLRFFEVSDTRIAFGPGAGLMLSVAIGSASLRAALVDANGALWHRYEASLCPGQLREPAVFVLDRIREACTNVLTGALADPALLVGQSLPLLGIAVAWPTALDRDKRPVGNSLAHPTWDRSKSLIQRVARHLSLDPTLIHAINDASAAAVAVAFDRTRASEHLRQSNPELTMVLRLAGNFGGGTIIIEPPKHHETWGMMSGFPRSVLLGGADHLSGEIGHIPVPGALVESINERDRNDPVRGLRKLSTLDCSCRARDEKQVPPHLEAYVSAAAVARRVAPKLPVAEALEQVVAVKTPAHRMALEDVGTLTGESLVGPVAWLNPASIVLTGSLAVPPVDEAIDAVLAEAHPIVSHPAVRCVAPEQNAYSRVRGAGLVVIREHVYRRFGPVLGGPEKTVGDRVRKLTTPIGSVPWVSTK